MFRLDQIKSLQAAGQSLSQIGKQLEEPRKSIYRALQRARLAAKEPTGMPGSKTRGRGRYSGNFRRR